MKNFQEAPLFSERDQRGIREGIVRPLDSHLRDVFISANIEDRLKDRPHAGWVLHRGGDDELILYALNINDALLGLKKVSAHRTTDVDPDRPIRVVLVRVDSTGEHYVPYEELERE